MKEIPNGGCILSDGDLESYVNVKSYVNVISMDSFPVETKNNTSYTKELMTYLRNCGFFSQRTPFSCAQESNKKGPDDAPQPPPSASSSIVCS